MYVWVADRVVASSGTLKATVQLQIIVKPNKLTNSSKCNLCIHCYCWCFRQPLLLSSEWLSSSVDSPTVVDSK